MSIHTCNRCGGLYATEDGEMFGGRPCSCENLKGYYWDLEREIPTVNVTLVKHVDVQEKRLNKACAEVDSLRAQLADCHKALVREREFNHDLAIACKGNKLNASATGEAIAREDAAVLRQENHQLRDQLAALRRELAEARRDGERLWQPMETAPRDGTAVLLSIEDSVDAAIFWKEQWLFRGEIPLTGEPDAWMPLPKPQAAARPSKP